MSVRLDASGSSVSDGSPIAEYSFGCGNGTGYQGGAPAMRCQYASAGVYLATVRVVDQAGHAGAATVSVRVRADVAPTPVLRAHQRHARHGYRVVLDGSRSFDPDHTAIASFRFACGATRTPAQRSPRTTCHFSRPGRYLVRMWVTDTGGRTALATMSIRVRGQRSGR